jgi:cupin 2 domain-containing protein
VPVRHYDRALMTARWRRGQLREGSTAPRAAEDVDRLLEQDGVVVEQILSGTLAAPVDYRQEHDEWVVLLEGHATLLVDGERVELNARDWLYVPALVEHTLVSTTPGSSWLAIHITR